MPSAPNAIGLTALAIGGALFASAVCAQDPLRDWRIDLLAQSYPTEDMRGLGTWTESIGDASISWSCEDCASPAWAALWIIPHTDVLVGEGIYAQRDTAWQDQQAECVALEASEKGECHSIARIVYDKAPGLVNKAALRTGDERFDAVLINARETLHAVSVGLEGTDTSLFLQGLAYWVLLKAQNW